MLIVTTPLDVTTASDERLTSGGAALLPASAVLPNDDHLVVAAEHTTTTTSDNNNDRTHIMNPLQQSQQNQEEEDGDDSDSNDDYSRETTTEEERGTIPGMNDPPSNNDIEKDDCEENDFCGDQKQPASAEESNTGSINNAKQSQQEPCPTKVSSSDVVNYNDSQHQPDEVNQQPGEGSKGKSTSLVSDGDRSEENMSMRADVETDQNVQQSNILDGEEDATCSPKEEGKPIHKDMDATSTEIAQQQQSTELSPGATTNRHRTPSAFLSPQQSSRARRLLISAPLSVGSAATNRLRAISASSLMSLRAPLFLKSKSVDEDGRRAEEEGRFSNQNSFDDEHHENQQVKTSTSLSVTAESLNESSSLQSSLASGLLLHHHEDNGGVSSFSMRNHRSDLSGNVTDDDDFEEVALFVEEENDQAAAEKNETFQLAEPKQRNTICLSDHPDNYYATSFLKHSDGYDSSDDDVSQQDENDDSTGSNDDSCENGDNIDAAAAAPAVDKQQSRWRMGVGRLPFASPRSQPKRAVTINGDNSEASNDDANNDGVSAGQGADTSHAQDDNDDDKSNTGSRRPSVSTYFSSPIRFGGKPRVTLPYGSGRSSSLFSRFSSATSEEADEELAGGAGDADDAIMDEFHDDDDNEAKGRDAGDVLTDQSLQPESQNEPESTKQDVPGGEPSGVTSSLQIEESPQGVATGEEPPFQLTKLENVTASTRQLIPQETFSKTKRHRGASTRSTAALLSPLSSFSRGVRFASTSQLPSPLRLFGSKEANRSSGDEVEESSTCRADECNDEKVAIQVDIQGPAAVAEVELLSLSSIASDDSSADSSQQDVDDDGSTSEESDSTDPQDGVIMNKYGVKARKQPPRRFCDIENAAAGCRRMDSTDSQFSMTSTGGLVKAFLFLNEKDGDSSQKLAESPQRQQSPRRRGRRRASLARANSSDQNDNDTPWSDGALPAQLPFLATEKSESAQQLDNARTGNAENRDTVEDELPATPLTRLENVTAKTRENILSSSRHQQQHYRHSAPPESVGIDSPPSSSYTSYFGLFGNNADSSRSDTPDKRSEGGQKDNEASREPEDAATAFTQGCGGVGNQEDGEVFDISMMRNVTALQRELIPEEMLRATERTNNFHQLNLNSLFIMSLSPSPVRLTRPESSPNSRPASSLFSRFQSICASREQQRRLPDRLLGQGIPQPKMRAQVWLLIASVKENVKANPGLYHDLVQQNMETTQKLLTVMTLTPGLEDTATTPAGGEQQGEQAESMTEEQARLFEVWQQASISSLGAIPLTLTTSASPPPSWLAAEIVSSQLQQNEVAGGDEEFSAAFSKQQKLLIKQDRLKAARKRNRGRKQSETLPDACFSTPPRRHRRLRGESDQTAAAPKLEAAPLQRSGSFKKLLETIQQDIPRTFPCHDMFYHNHFQPDIHDDWYGESDSAGQDDEAKCGWNDNDAVVVADNAESTGDHIGSVADDGHYPRFRSKRVQDGESMDEACVINDPTAGGPSRFTAADPVTAIQDEKEIPSRADNETPLNGESMDEACVISDAAAGGPSRIAAADPVAARQDEKEELSSAENDTPPSELKVADSKSPIGDGGNVCFVEELNQTAITRCSTRSSISSDAGLASRASDHGEEKAAEENSWASSASLSSEDEAKVSLQGERANLIPAHASCHERSNTKRVNEFPRASYSSLPASLSSTGKRNSRSATRTRMSSAAAQERKKVLRGYLGQASLRRVLTAYCLYDREVGYCQGMNFLAAMFLTLVSEEQAFWLLVYVMSDSSPCQMRGLFEKEMKKTHQVLHVAERLLQEFLPNLAQHLENECIHVSMFATQWLLTQFTICFDLEELVIPVWDCFLMEGWRMSYRVMIALLSQWEERLLQLSFEELLNCLLREVPRNVNGQEVLDAAMRLPLQETDITKYEDEWARLCN